MATAQLRNAASRVASRKGEAIADLMLEVAQFFFRLRALGQKTGPSPAGALARSASCAVWH
jgi:hypothetical protein